MLKLQIVAEFNGMNMPMVMEVGTVDTDIVDGNYSMRIVDLDNNPTHPGVFKIKQTDMQNFCRELYAPTTTPLDVRIVESAKITEVSMGPDGPELGLTDIKLKEE